MFYIKYFLDLLLWNRFLFRNCHFLTHLLLTTLDVLTILWTSYIVTSTKTLQNWHIQYLSFHLAPCLLSLTKIENLSKIWKWNAKAKKHKFAPPSHTSPSSYSSLINLIKFGQIWSKKNRHFILSVSKTTFYSNIFRLVRKSNLITLDQVWSILDKSDPKNHKKTAMYNFS